MIKKFQSSRPGRRWIYNRPMAILLAVLLIWLGRAVYLTGSRERLASQERAAVLAQVVALEARRTQLTADLASLQTDRGVEERIRQQYSVARPGEKVFNVVLSATSTATSSPPTLPWWQPLLDLFN